MLLVVALVVVVAQAAVAWGAAAGVLVALWDVVARAEAREDQMGEAAAQRAVVQEAEDAAVTAEG